MENENINMQEENNNVVDTANTTPNDVSNEVDTDTESETFTQSQLNDIVRARLDKQQLRFFGRYNVKNRDELDALVGKSQAYDIMKERYTGMNEKNNELTRELAFLRNNVNPTRKDDIMAYFKGKSLDFNEDNLKNEISTHPEWLNPVKVDEKPKTTIATMGSDNSVEKPKISEKDEMARIFGLSRLI